MAAPKVGELPEDQLKAIQNANIEARGRENATTPAEQRVINPANIELSNGPIRGANDSFLPATYATSRKNIRTDR